MFADEQGRFDLRVRPSAPYTVSVAKAGFVTVTVSLRAPSSAGALEIRIPRGGVIAGRVVDAAGRPVVGAGVRARRIDGQPRDAAAPSENRYIQTDDLGEYRLSGLAAGRYEVHSIRGIDSESAFRGIDPAADDRLRQLRQELLPRSVPMSAGSVVDVRSGAEVSLTLVHGETAVILPYATVGGVVTGVLTDAWGEPAEGISVRLWQIGFANGRPEARAAGLVRVTDDRGRYRLFHIPAGRYLVVATDEVSRDDSTQPSGPSSASQPFAPASSYVPVYYPGRTSVADASPVQVPPATQVSGIDMVFTQTREASVFGVAVTAAGQPLQAVVTLAASHRSGALALPIRRAPAADGGRFEFLNIPPGEYVIRTTVGNDTTLEFGAQFVTVNQVDAGPVILKTSPTATVTGRIVLEGARSVVPNATDPLMNPIALPRREAAPADFVLRAVATDPDGPADGSGNRATPLAIQRDWTFRVSGLLGPTRFTLSSGPEGWWMKSAHVGSGNAAIQPVTFGARDDSRDDVTIVLAATGASVTGRVVDERSRPVEDFWAIVFATDQDQWFTGSPYVRSNYARANGTFSVTSLPPGDYWVAAIDSIEGDSVSGDWQSQALLSGLISSARRITLSEGERATTQLRLQRVVR